MSLLDDEDVLLDPERDKEIIKSWIEDNYTIRGHLKINDDLTVDCSGNVTIKNTNIESLTNGMFYWGKIGWNFDCSGCENLRSLEGAPEKVGGCFYCDFCKNLKSLEGAPKEVGNYFNCTYCKNLKSLDGGPKVVGKNFNCSNCFSLTDISRLPKKVRNIVLNGCISLSDQRDKIIESIKTYDNRIGVIWE